MEKLFHQTYTLCQGALIMIDHSKQKAEKIKAFKKLMAKWLAMQETANKANLLLDKNPEIKFSPKRNAVAPAGRPKLP
jgi:hypothetical protein